MRTHVDLFSGIGGFALAARWAGVETIAFAEIDPYASRVLERHFSGVRNYGDVRNVPEIDAWLVTGGVPCQPASVAGKRRGTEDDRWLWPEAIAAVERIRPAWVLFENPTGILSLNDGLEFERICLALEGQGYEVQPIVIPACGVGAKHRRNRVWIAAHSTRDILNGSGYARTGWWAEPSNGSTHVAHPDGTRSQGWVGRELQERTREQPFGASSAYMADALNDGSYRAGANAPEPSGNESNDGLPIGSDTWAIEPDVGRVANGIPKRVDRLRTLGNAIVPQVAYQLIKRMIESEGLVCVQG